MYELTVLSEGKKAFQNKWVYKMKPGRQESTQEKARMVVKGFQQENSIDFNEIFVSVVKMTSIQTTLSIAAIMDLEVEPMDFKTTFVRGDVEEEVYMQQPECRER